MQTKPAKDLQVGEVVVERDGYLLKIETINQVRGLIHLSLKGTGLSARQISAKVRPHSLVKVSTGGAA